MKVQCDVCEQAPASLICCADEAALCSACDTRVHAANKLASKHQRLALLPPSSSTLCDICQERSGFFFCLEDRALLCRDCDVSIHSVNALAAQHKRFLLTGVRVALNAVTAPDARSEQSVASGSATKEAASSAKSAAPIANLFSTKVKPSNFANDRSELSHWSSVLKSTPGLSMQRLSSGRVPFIAPVLTTTSIAAEFASNESGKKGSVSEFFTKGIPGWMLDELLTDVTGVQDCGDNNSSKDDVPFDEQDWAAELNLFEGQLSPEGPAEVPQLPSPPTSSGLARAQLNTSNRLEWTYDFLFGLEENEIPLVPDIERGSSSSPPPAPKRCRNAQWA